MEHTMRTSSDIMQDRYIYDGYIQLIIVNRDKFEFRAWFANKIYKYIKLKNISNLIKRIYEYSKFKWRQVSP